MRKLAQELTVKDGLEGIERGPSVPPPPPAEPGEVVDEDTLVARHDLPPGSYTLIAAGDSIPAEWAANQRLLHQGGPGISGAG